MIVIAKAEIRPEKRDAFLAAARIDIAASRAEAGCIAYDMTESVTAPNHFFFVERYTDRAALDIHMASPHLKAFLAATGPCLAGAPSIEAIDPKSIDRLM